MAENRKMIKRGKRSVLRQESDEIENLNIEPKSDEPKKTIPVIKKIKNGIIKNSNNNNSHLPEVKALKSIPASEEEKLSKKKLKKQRQKEKKKKDTKVENEKSEEENGENLREDPKDEEKEILEDLAESSEGREKDQEEVEKIEKKNKNGEKMLEIIREFEPKMLKALDEVFEKKNYRKSLTALESIDELSPKSLTALESIDELSPKLLISLESIDELSPKSHTALESIDELSPKSLTALESIDDLSPKLLTALESVDEISPEFFNIKHPLLYTWTLWYFEHDKNKTWQECNHEVASFNTAEDFWCLYNHLKFIPDLKKGSDYSLFKKGIRPMWEDDANVDGGRWLITFDRRTDIDKYWLETLLCTIGEGFEEFSSDICGAVFNLRKQDKISLWTADSKNKKGIMEIGRIFKERLGISSDKKVGYQIHKDVQKPTGSTLKNTYML